MGLVQRQTIKSSVFSYIGTVLGYVNIIFLFPLAFSTEQFGLTQLLLAVSQIFAQFSRLGVTQIIPKFFPYFKDPKNKHGGFLFFAFVMPTIGFAIFTVLFLLFRENILAFYQEKSALFVEHYKFVFPLTAFIVYFTVLESYSWSLYRVTVPTMIRDVGNRLFIMIFIGLHYFGVIDFLTFLYLFASVYALSFLILVVYIISLRQWHLKPVFGLFRKKVFKIMVNYGLFAVLNGATNMLVNRIDVVMLGALAAKGLTDTAIYAVAFAIATVIQIPQRNINKITTPLVANAWKAREFEKIKVLYKKTSLTQLIIGLFLFIGIWINIDDLFQLMPKSDIYQQGKSVILFVGIARLFDMATGINNSIIITSKHYRYNLYFLLLLIVLAVFTNYLFIPPLGIVGAALATMISIVLFNTLKLLFLLIKYKMQPFSFATLGVLIISLIALAVGLWIPSVGNIFLDIIIRSVVVTILFGASILGFDISEDITGMYRNLKKRFFG